MHRVLNTEHHCYRTFIVGYTQGSTFLNLSHNWHIIQLDLLFTEHTHADDATINPTVDIHVYTDERDISDILPLATYRTYVQCDATRFLLLCCQVFFSLFVIL